MMSADEEVFSWENYKIGAIRKWAFFYGKTGKELKEHPIYIGKSIRIDLKMYWVDCSCMWYQS